MSLITASPLIDLLGILIALLAVAYAYVRRCYQYWEQRNVPFEPPKFPWGNVIPPHKRTISAGEDITNKYQEGKAEGWKYFGLYVFTVPVFMPLDLDLIKNIMSKDFNHFVDRGTYVNEKDEPIGAHLFSIGGLKWKNLRKKFTPTFTSGKMKIMFQSVANCGLILEDCVKNSVANNEPLEIKNVLARFTTDNIGTCAFGLECNSLKDPDTPFRKYGDKAFIIGGWKALRVTVADLFPDIGRFFRICIFEKEVSQFFTKVVKDTIRYRQKENVVRKDFLQMCIDLMNEEDSEGDGTSLTLEEIVSQCFIFFLAGYETSSTTITFALYELAVNPDIQDRVRKEIQTLLSKYNNQVTYDALNELKYMGQVLDETMRKYPTLPFVTRQCVKDYKIPNEDIIIEKGTKVIIPIRGIHHDEDYYESPDVFDPERFNDDNKRTRHSYSHMPFGEGPRICIGMRFGIMQVKVGLISILKNFRIRLNDKTKVPIKLSIESFISTPEEGIWLDFEKAD